MGRPVWTALVVLLAATTCWPLAGGPASAATTTPVPVCQVASKVTSLVVSRAVASNPTTFSFPRRTVVDSAKAARSVAGALCALPRIPRGPIACPDDVGPTYTLGFVAAGHDVTKLTLDPTGCEVVHGLSGIRWIEQSPKFWRVLGAAMGLASPSQATFAGGR